MHFAVIKIHDRKTHNRLNNSALGATTLWIKKIALLDI